MRELFGYERFDSLTLIKLMNEIYKDDWNKLQNFFVPQVKLIKKSRVGSKYKKQYSKPKTPYQRLMDSKDVTAEAKAGLEGVRKTLNPFVLRESIERRLKAFFKKLKTQDIMEGQKAS